MDTVVIDGVTYTKASTLAKEFRYTTDYVGQLCRAEKVSAQLVGRSWYVSRSSLEEHASKRVEALRQDEMSLENNPFLKVGASPMRVSAPLSKTTKKMLQSPAAPANVFDSYTTARYEADTVDLLPSLAVRPVLPATDFVNKTVVQAEPSAVGNNFSGNTSFSVPINQHKVAKVSPENSIEVPRLKITSMPNTAVISHKKQLHSTISKVPQTQVTTLINKPLSFTPASVVATPAPKSYYGVLAVCLVLLGLGTVLATLTLDLEVYSDGVVSSTHFSFNQTALVTFFENF